MPSAENAVLIQHLLPCLKHVKSTASLRSKVLLNLLLLQERYGVATDLGLLWYLDQQVHRLWALMQTDCP